MLHTALISFLTSSINTRMLSSWLKVNGFDCNCYFCPGPVNDRNLRVLISHLRESRVGLVGVSLMTDDYFSAVLLTQALKKELGIPVIWGGAHVNVCPDESLRHADMICQGEGEEALLDLVRTMSATGSIDSSIQNIWFRTGATIIRNPLRRLEDNLDKYPFPSFDLATQFVLEEEGLAPMTEEHLEGWYTIMTSRGCPYRCSYCYNNYRWKSYEGKGRYLRARSIDNVIEELALARRQFSSVRTVAFLDDSFLARDMADFVAFRDKYNAQIHLPFFALIEPMAFKRDKIKLLRECGLSRLQVGVQTGSERINFNVYGRRVTNRHVIATAHDLHEMGIQAIYDIIFNNPYETRDDVMETLRLLLAFPRPFQVQGFNLIFYPGTTITDNALKDGFIAPKPVTEDFSTIESAANSPVSMMGKAKVSERFYVVNYSSTDKAYLNSVIALMSSPFVPLPVIRYFGESEGPLKRVLLTAFIQGLSKGYKTLRPLYRSLRSCYRFVRQGQK